MVKNILSALAVAVFGFILLNIAFLFDYLLHSLVMKITTPFLPVSPYPEMTNNWLPPLMHILFMAFNGLISWLIFRTKLGVLYKAIYLTVPLAVVFVTIGIFLYQWPVAAYSLCGFFAMGALYYFYRTKQPWLYSYTVILVGLVLAIFSLSGGEI